MSKIDDFKKFVSKNDSFIDEVKNNNTSWQKLYELYDIYGEDNEVWNKYLKKDSLNIKSIFNTIKNINMDSLEENINSISKVVGLVEEFSKDSSSEEKTTPKESEIEEIYGE